MRGERIEIRHRVKGRPALIRATRGLLLRVHRYGRGRARTPDEIRWTARALDALDVVLRVMELPGTDASTMRSSTPGAPGAPVAREVSR
jgi:hypothetical protein